VEFLHEHIDRKLILISAPAGYGKTTLLVDFAHETDLAVCWYTLDPTDRDPRVFVEHLLTSLARRFPGFGGQTRRVIEAGASLSDGGIEVVGTLVNEMVALIPEWFVLILDDFHHIEDAAEVTALLTALLTYQPEHCHLIIASRTVPGSLPFISLAARGEVVGLGQDDLRFTVEEVRALLYQRQQVRITAEEAERLVRDSEGWIAGILLSSHAPQMGTGIWARARASGRPVYDYLAGEVLKGQEAGLREFLLASSTLEEMSPPLCEEVLGLKGAEEHLRRLEQRNLFVVRMEGEKDTFRYHALFREFLQTRLKETAPETFRDLHRRAGMWFEREGEADRAARHYLAMGEPAEAARVMEEAAETLLRSGRLETLIGWAERLPEEALRPRPRLALFAAKAASRAGRMERTGEWLEMAERAFGEEEGDLLAMVLSAQALIRYNQGRYEEGIGLAERALSLLSDEGAANEGGVEAERVWGLCLMRLGQFEEAEQHLQAALERCQGIGDAHREALIQAGLAGCFSSRGHLKEAVRLQRTVVETCRRLGSPGYLAEALNDLACNLYLLGEYDEALRGLGEALEAARGIGHRRVEAFILISLGEMLRDLGDPKGAVEELKGGLEIADDLGAAFLSAYGREALALAHLRLEEGEQALELAEEAVGLAEGQGTAMQAGRCQATLGLVQVETGRVEEGVGNLEEACRRLEGEGTAQEVARARLLLAWALHRAGREEEALETLARALRYYLEAGRENYLLVEGRSVMPLLERAAEKGVGGERLAAVLKEAGRLRTAARSALRQRARRTTAAPVSLRVYGFGAGRVERDGVPIPASNWPTTSARHFFFYLLSHPPRSRERIGADLWPDLRPSRLPGTFHNTKYRMQQALGVNPVVYEEGVYLIGGDADIWYDVREFERLLERARRSPPAKAARYRRRALALYTGDFLEGCYAEWCEARREVLRQQYLETVGLLADWQLERGRYDEAIEALRRGLETDNLREDFHRRLMRAYALKGQPEEAIAQYRRCVRILQQELGIEPEPETERLFQAIRDGRFPPSDG